jgi:uncharacterized integral membrane protein
MASPRPTPQPNAKPSPITPRRVVIALLVVAAVIFIVQNTSETDVSWLFLGFSAPLWLLTVVLLGVGFVVGWLVGRPSRSDRKG